MVLLPREGVPFKQRVLCLERGQIVKGETEQGQQTSKRQLRSWHRRVWGTAQCEVTGVGWDGDMRFNQRTICSWRMLVDPCLSGLRQPREHKTIGSCPVISVGVQKGRYPGEHADQNPRSLSGETADRCESDTGHMALWGGDHM